MPIHDWTRVAAGTWHDFHLAWIAELRNALNGGLLPASFYAQAEQVIGPMGPDVLTLQESASLGGGESPMGSGGVAVAERPPRMRIQAESGAYLLRKRRIVVRHNSGDRIVAMIELVSPGNKASTAAMRSFLDKAYDAIERGYHLLVIDLFPPTPRDPDGIHNAIWSELGAEPEAMPADEPLTLAAYTAGLSRTANVEPTAVGRTLIDMPLFLTADFYVNVPLEQTYMAAYHGMPRKWMAVLEA